MEQMVIESTLASAGVTLFKLKGPFTLGTMFDFQKMLRESTGKGSIIDLTEVPYMDSAGLGVLLGHFAHSQTDGSLYAIVGVSPRIRTIFEITHTDQVLPIFASQADAEAGFAKTAQA